MLNLTWKQLYNLKSWLFLNVLQAIFDKMNSQAAGEGEKKPPKEKKITAAKENFDEFHIPGAEGEGKATKKRLSVERIYQKKSQLEHILLRPDTYIGSVESVTQVDMGLVARKPVFRVSNQTMLKPTYSVTVLQTGMRKFRIDQDFLIEHWHMIYIMPVIFAEIYFWMKWNSILDIN